MAYFKIASAISTGDTFQLHGDGSVRRDFTHVSDTVSAIEKLLHQQISADVSINDVVNIGGGNPYSMLEMIDALEKISGKQLNLINTSPTAGDVQETVASTTRQRLLTGFVPETTLNDGLLEFYSWHSQHWNK